MLQIVIQESEKWDELKEEFVYGTGHVLQLEHSLVSLSKWESKWNKPFLSKNNKTYEEITDYIRCMTLTQNVDSRVYDNLSQDNIIRIQEYIDAPMTATTFSKDTNKPNNGGIVTAEIIYYWMISFNIPFECQKWHLNRLLTLIKVCDRKNRPPSKMSRKSILSHNASLNAIRRKRLNSKG